MKGESSDIELRLAEQIRAAPELLQSYIGELERQHDAAVVLRQLVYAREETRALSLALVELKEAIRKQRED